jgi:hypothetical protein
MTARPTTGVALAAMRMSVLGVLLLAAGLAHAAPRGSPGSDTRTKWCADKLDDCKSKANDYCNKKAGDNAGNAMICYTGAAKACEISWGEESSCKTDARIVQPYKTVPDALGGAGIEQSPSFETTTPPRLLTPTAPRQQLSPQ